MNEIRSGTVQVTGADRSAEADGSSRAIVSWASASAGNVAGVVAILGGLAVGGLTGGLIPGLSGFNHTDVGIPALQAWATAVAIYIIGLCIARMVADDGFHATLLGLLRKAEAVVAPAGAPSPFSTQKQAGKDATLR